MVIFLQPDHELPLISATARIRGGSVYEPANKTGLTDLYGDVWRTGGTKTKTGDQMDDFLEARAAKIETDNQSDSTTISLNCLKGDFDAVFDMYLDLLHNPEFRADKLELSKRQMYTVDFPPQRQRRVDRRPREPHHRLRQGQPLRARSGVRDRRGRNATGPASTGISSSSIPTTSSSASPATSIPQTMETKLRQAFESWSKGPAGQAARHQVHRAQTGLILRRQVRREPDDHQHARPRHRAQQSGLFRGHGDERDLRRWILVASLQRPAYRERSRIFRWRRSWLRMGSSGD